MTSEIFVIDTETTTCFNPYYKGHIVEIGVAVVDFDAGTVQNVFSKVVRPSEIDKDAWVFRNTTLTVKEVENGSDMNIVDVVLSEMLCNLPVTSYNVDFDMPMLEEDMPRTAKAIRLSEDIMLAASRVEEIPRRHAGGNCYPRLEAAYNHLCPEDPANINGVEEHRALSDAMVAGYVMLELWRRGMYNIPEDEAIQS